MQTREYLAHALYRRNVALSLHAHTSMKICFVNWDVKLKSKYFEWISINFHRIIFVFYSDTSDHTVRFGDRQLHSQSSTTNTFGTDSRMPRLYDDNGLRWVSLIASLIANQFHFMTHRENNIEIENNVNILQWNDICRSGWRGGGTGHIVNYNCYLQWWNMLCLETRWKLNKQQAIWKLPEFSIKSRKIHLSIDFIHHKRWLTMRKKNQSELQKKKTAALNFRCNEKKKRKQTASLSQIIC